MADIWLPETPPYLAQAEDPHVLPHRPVFQGDVFRDIPVAMFTKHKANPPEEKELTAKRTTAMAFTHPCSARSRGGRLQTPQVVARVLTMEKATRCEGWESPWSGYFPLYPLPNLLGGEDYVADLGQVAIVNPEYLTESRIACLSQDWWTGLLWRVAHLIGRFKLDPKLLKETNAHLWNELDIWTKWVSRTGSEDGFQKWLNEESATRAPAKRREILAGAPEEVEAELP